MPSFVTVTSGATAQAQDVNQIINALNGTAGQGVPISLTALNDSVNFALAIKNADPTNSRTLQVLRSNNNVLLQADASGVIVSPDGGATTSQVVSVNATQTLTNKTIGALVNGALPVSGQALGADVTITVAGTYVTAVSVSLAAGTWILSSYATIRGPTVGSVEATVQLTDGTTTFASAEATTGAASRLVPFALGPVVVTPGTTTTYSLRVTTDAGTDGLVKATTPANGALSNATRITAVRIG